MKRPPREGLRVGIVNPSTFVGKEVKSILHERGVPYVHIALIDTTGEAAGTITEVDDEAAVVAPATTEAFEDLDVVFFCGSPDANAEWLARFADAQFLAVDLSQPSSQAADGVPVVAGVNANDVTERTRVVISPHPIAIPIALVLHQITSRVGVKLAAVSVIQPASEFDQAGIDELLQQVIKVLNVESYPKEVFDRQLAFNLYPAARALELEQYAVEQLHQILGKPIPLSIALTQGTTFHSHSFSMFIQTDRDLAESEILDLLKENDAILVGDEEDNFGTLDAGGKDQVLVGRVVKDTKIPNSFWIWAVVDNLRRSSALNGVLAAEAILARILADA